MMHIEKTKKSTRKDYRRQLKREAILKSVERLSRDLDLPGTTTTRAIELCDRFAGLFSWRRVDGIAGACAYAACKVDGVPRLLSEFLERYDDAGERRFHGCLKVLSRAYHYTRKTPDLAPLLRRRGEQLGVPARVMDGSLSILEHISGQNCIQGKDPNGIIAACLYIASKKKGMKVTQARIAGECGIDVTTMRKRIRLIEKACKIQPK